MELPDDWYADNDGQSRILEPEKVAVEIERLRAIEKAARTYYHNYCQDEADEEGICGLAQQLDAIALRDALAVEQCASGKEPT